ncbi:hypothetical protein ACMBCN_01180 [Candidatus Liberibacter asiaticus]|nr:hypothetical protein [Candidatus Liberibacter asiaticus]
MYKPRLYKKKVCSFYFVICLFIIIIIIFEMFVGIITENSHETLTCPLGQLMGLTACCIC